MKPVQYDPANQEIVDAFNKLIPAPADYWNRDDIGSVRKQIKDHYIAEQKQTCCYCNFPIPTKHNLVWDAEHIIPRALAPQFLFEPRNLAVACKDCNGAKSDEEVRVNARRVTFPDKSADYKIVHPHFDEYEEHIRWFGAICMPLTNKGKSTIETCSLLRISLNTVGDSTIPRHLAYDKFIGTVISAKDKDEALMALAGLMKFVENIPQK